MKKALLSIVLLFSFLSAFTQINTAEDQQTLRIVNQHNFRQEISMVFSRAQQARKITTEHAIIADKTFSSAAIPADITASLPPSDLTPKIQKAYISQRKAVRDPKKQWQVALFLADRNRPLSETLNILRQKIANGDLRHAAVLDITPHTANQSPQKETPSPAQDYPAVFYFLYMGKTKPVTEKITADSTVNTAELLSPLFEHFQNTQDVYSAVIIDGHGSGFDMFYGENGWMDMEHILSALQETGLSLDILDLASCHMASLYNLYQLSKYKNITYLVASSDIMTGSTEQMYYTLLPHLNVEPRQAAINAVHSARSVHRFNSSYTTNNVMALHLPVLFSPVENWFNDYANLMLADSEQVKQGMMEAFDPRWGTWRSLHKILRRQIEYLLNSQEETVEGNDYELSELKENCIQSSRILADALQKSTLTQWCYSEQLGRVYVNQIPPNIDCLDSVSVTKEQLEYLIETESPKLEQQVKKRYRCVG